MVFTSPSVKTPTGKMEPARLKAMVAVETSAHTWNIIATRSLASVPERVPSMPPSVV